MWWWEMEGVTTEKWRALPQNKQSCVVSHLVFIADLTRLIGAGARARWRATTSGEFVVRVQVDLKKNPRVLFVGVA